MKKFVEILTRILAIIFLPILMIVAAIAGLFQRPIQRTREEVAGIIDRFLNGTSTDTEWDDFVCVPLADSTLEEIRKRCSVLDEEYPPIEKYSYCNDQGTEILKEYVKQLRGGITSNST